jgi:hypothetical protein
MYYYRDKTAPTENICVDSRKGPGITEAFIKEWNSKRQLERTQAVNGSDRRLHSALSRRTVRAASDVSSPLSNIPIPSLSDVPSVSWEVPKKCLPQEITRIGKAQGVQLVLHQPIPGT